MLCWPLGLGRDEVRSRELLFGDNDDGWLTADTDMLRALPTGF